MTTRKATLHNKSIMPTVQVATARKVVDLESILKPRPEAEIRREIEAKARARFAGR
jgi:hypothetical protein